MENKKSACACGKENAPARGQKNGMDFSLLQKYKIPVLKYSVARKESEAALAAKKISYPVVLKLVSPKALHKSEMRALSLDVHDEETLRKEFLRLSHLVPPVFFGGVLVQKHQKAHLELIIGGKRDAQFGPVLLLGVGGIYTEIIGDTALRICPVSEAQALDMIRSLKAYPILAGARGQKEINEKELAQILVRTGKMMMKENVRELDINPLLWTENGFAAADARVLR